MYEGEFSVLTRQVRLILLQFKEESPKIDVTGKLALPVMERGTGGITTSSYIVER